MISKKIEVTTYQINATVTAEQIVDLSKLHGFDIDIDFTKKLNEHIQKINEKCIETLNELLDNNTAISEILNIMINVGFGTYAGYDKIKQHVLETRSDKKYLIDLYELNLF